MTVQAIGSAVWATTDHAMPPQRTPTEPITCVGYTVAAPVRYRSLRRRHRAGVHPRTGARPGSRGGHMTGDQPTGREGV
jgi:hypothetical protein